MSMNSAEFLSVDHLMLHCMILFLKQWSITGVDFNSFCGLTQSLYIFNI